jgi:hypothetical protein
MDYEHQIIFKDTKQYIRDLLGLGMAIGLAVGGYMRLICLGSLVRVFVYCE